MGVAYKNFRSLNIDEAVVTGILRANTNKNIEVLMPINSQMKDIDLVLININNKKTITIQVKGSRAYEPRKKETERYEDGSAGWFFLKKEIIQQSTADYFIFLVYVIHEQTKTGRRTIKPHTITIPTKRLKELCTKNKKPHPDRYSFYFRINPKKKIAFDFREENDGKKYYITDFLDEKGINELNNVLK